MKICTPVGELELPDSVPVAQQVRSYTYVSGIEVHQLHLRWDDPGKHGANQFSVSTASYERLDESVPLQYATNSAGKRVPLGLVNRGTNFLGQDALAAFFPEVAALAAYHLVAPDGPLHYFANSAYFAGDLDCWGYRKDEQRRANDSGLPLWRISWEQAKTLGLDTLVAVAEKPCHDATPWLMEGKDREPDLARRSALWPDASDADLMLPKEALMQQLHDRLPGLMQGFKAQLEAAGFTY
jgi:hypothetical protein